MTKFKRTSAELFVVSWVRSVAGGGHEKHENNYISCEFARFWSILCIGPELLGLGIPLAIPVIKVEFTVGNRSSNGAALKTAIFVPLSAKRTIS